MKKLLLTLLGLALWAAPSLAQSPISPSQMTSEIATQLPTNNVGAISALKLRGVLNDMLGNFTQIGVDKTTSPWTLCAWTSSSCSPFGFANPTTGRISLGGATNILTLLSVADAAGIVARDGVNRATVLNAALAAAGSGNIFFPDGLYVAGASLNITTAQNINCGSQDGGAGATIAVTAGLNAPLFVFTAQGGIRGCNLLGDVTDPAQNGQSLVRIDGATSNVILDNDFFSGGYNGVEINGNGFYNVVSNSEFSGQYHRFIYGHASVVGAGFDLTIRNAKFLSGTVTMDYGWFLDGLGSLIASDVVMSTGHYINGTVYWNRPASLFGGAQISNSVFEGGAPGAAVWIVGNSAGNPWNNFHTVNTFLTAGNGSLIDGSAPALQCINASRFRFAGGAIATSATTGNSISVPPGSTCTDFSFSGTSYDLANAITVFGTTTDDVTVSGSIIAPNWAGATPLVDFTATTTAAHIPYLDVAGGNPGSNATPVRLPAGVPGVRCYLNVSCATTGFANPSVLVGLTAKNGTASSAMRADAAPALDQSISPSMTGLWSFSQQVASTIATGTAPFSVASTTQVPNLFATKAATANAWTTARNLAGNSVDGSGNVAFANGFWVKGTTDTGLSGAQFMGALGTGLVKNATTTGVPSIVTEGTGVETALGVNVGSAGAVVVNGGALGTPSSGTLSSATGLPISTGVSGLGTGIATALAVNAGSAGAPVLFNGAGGTPSSLTLTNATSLPPSALGGLSNLYVALGSNVNITVAGTYVTGPSLGQATTAGFTWYVSGHVALTDGTNPEVYSCKLWDGTTVMDSAAVSVNVNNTGSMSLAGVITSPAAAIKISCTASNTTSFINTNASGNSKDSSIVGFRIN